MAVILSDGLSVELALACEDVREEKGNKLSLMGVFSGDIIVAEMPAQIRIAFYFAVRGASVRKWDLRTRLMVGEIEAGSTVTRIEYDLPDTVANVIIPLGFIGMEQPGDFAVRLSVGESGEDIEVIRKRVFKAPTS